MDLTILKVGGSVITFKDKPLRINRSNIERISREIAEALRIKPQSLVIIHGAGSYGHPQVMETGIHLGVSNRRQLVDMARIQSLQNLLNYILTRRLQLEGVPAYPMQSSALALMNKGELVDFYLKTVKTCLKIGLIPVLYGVPAIDESIKCSILSGDEISIQLAHRLKARRVIHGTCVDGVFTEDPNLSKDAKLVEVIDRDNFKEVLNALSKSGGMDATGGMYGKVLKLVWLAERGVEGLIVNASKPGVIFNALLGERVKGTLVRF